MKRKREWFENERFWRELFPYMFHPARFEQAAAEVRYLFHHTFYSGQELRMLLEQAGFASVTLCGHLDGRPYGPDAPRLLAVARTGASNAS